MGEIAQARKDLNFMPDALKVIPDVVEEMVEDQDQDQMEIDARNGRGSTQDDTLTACVQCLLQCFNPTASSGAGQSTKPPPSKSTKFKSHKKKKKKRNMGKSQWEAPSVKPC